MDDLSAAQCVLLDTPLRPPGWRWDPVCGLGRTEPSCTAPGQASPLETGVPTPVPLENLPTAESARTADPEIERALRIASARFAHALAETLDGKRRLTQLETWFDPESLRVLADRMPRLKGTHVRLASVRVQPVSDRSAEVALRLGTPQTDYAAALRVTRQADNWSCTDLVIG